MNETLGYLKTFARFPFALRRFLQHPLTLKQAEEIIDERLQQREENFLRVVERSIFGYPRSPYLALLKLAGCELGDLRALVRQRGLECALRELREEGVYVTFEEFKGRRPIVRNGTTICTTPRDFNNPSSRRDFTLLTGGSTGLASSVNQDLDYIAAGAPHQIITLAAYDLLDAPLAYWMNILPGNALRFILQRAYLGHYPLRWFSSTGWRDSKQWLKYDLATLYMTFWINVFGAHRLFPQIVKLDEALTVARWAQQTLKNNERCLLYIGASRALRVSLAAQQAGIDLTGLTVRMGGEPVTAIKLRRIQDCGIRSLIGYGTSETGTLGFGCQHPAHTDDVHFFHDSFALIAYPHPLVRSDATVPAFNLTCLMDSSPKVMLNYQTDDYGVLEERSCGCPLGTYGYSTHLSEIRSYSKLLGEGVTLIGNEMLHILEEVLPARFGGSLLDYQLMEEEDEQGFTRTYLVISPRIEIADEGQVIDVVLNALTEQSPMADAARRVWQQAQTVRIKRMEPKATERGKFSPLNIQLRARDTRVTKGK